MVFVEIYGKWRGSLVSQTFIPISVEDPRPEKQDFEKLKQSLSLSLQLALTLTQTYSSPLKFTSLKKNV